jgi:hypothetical protein
MSAKLKDGAGQANEIAQVGRIRLGCAASTGNPASTSPPPVTSRIAAICTPLIPPKAKASVFAG